MKVNMALLSDDEEMLQDAVMPDMSVPDDEDSISDTDESDNHSRLKVILLIAVMIGGFVLAVWNLTSLVNNMRLDNQGYPVHVVSEMENIDDFLNDTESSSSTGTSDIMQENSETSSETARDGPDSDEAADADEASDVINETAENTDLKEELEKANNEAAFVRQELKNAEDMLDLSLEREAALQKKINELNAENY